MKLKEEKKKPNIEMDKKRWTVFKFWGEIKCLLTALSPLKYGDVLNVAWTSITTGKCRR